MTFAELCASVGGQLEIDQTDYVRFHLQENANHAVRELARTLPVELIPELMLTQLVDFEITGTFEPPDDFIRTIRLFLTYSGSALGDSGAEAREVLPQDWPPTKSLSDVPTMSYPAFTQIGDLWSLAPTGIEGVVRVLPLPAAKVTNGVYHQYVGVKDPVDSSNDVPLGLKLHNLLINTTCKRVCLVEHFDEKRSVAFDALIKDELSRLIPSGR